MSEDEGDDDEPPEVKIDEEKAQQLRKARAEREEKLRQMMEESGESPVSIWYEHS
jgi:DNA polymerase delta subunit 3